MPVNGTVLSVLQAAAAEMALPEFGSAAGNIQQIPQQLLSLYNLTGEMLVKRRVWRCLEREHSFDAVQDVATYPLPPDFARPISQTEWDRTNRWPMIGPETPQQWQWLKSGILSTGPRERFRLIGNTMEIWPVPGSDTVPLPVKISYFYISKWWVETADGQPKKKADRDDDTCVFGDTLMTTGVKLRYYQAKGFDTTAFAADFQNNLDDALSQDGGAPILSMARSVNFPLISTWNLQDGNFPGPSA